MPSTNKTWNCETVPVTAVSCFEELCGGVMYVHTLLSKANVVLKTYIFPFSEINMCIWMSGSSFHTFPEVYMKNSKEPIFQKLCEQSYQNIINVSIYSFLIGVHSFFTRTQRNKEHKECWTFPHIPLNILMTTPCAPPPPSWPWTETLNLKGGGSKGVNNKINL